MIESRKQRHLCAALFIAMSSVHVGINEKNFQCIQDLFTAICHSRCRGWLGSAEAANAATAETVGLCALSMPAVGGCPIALWTQVSLYWLVLIKLQESVLLLMLPDPLLYNFWVTVVLAIVGQSLGLLQMLFEQVK
jgi:hypothetical protein